MINTDKTLAWLTLVSGLLISGVSIYYSVSGLMSIFAAAAIPIMIMGVFLETSKLVASVWLKKYWHVAPLIIKSYLLGAVVILMFITSMGTYGFLSKSHLDQSAPSAEASARVMMIDEQIKSHEENIMLGRKALSQLDVVVDQTIARSSSEQGASNAVSIRRSQTRERNNIQNDISQNQNSIAELQTQRAPFAKEMRVAETEVGPIKYIAALMYSGEVNHNMLESAVRFVIILIVIVFDPLAVILLLTSQYSFQYAAQQESAKKLTLKQELEQEIIKLQTQQVKLAESQVMLQETKVQEEIQHELQQSAVHVATAFTPEPELEQPLPEPIVTSSMIESDNDDTIPDELVNEIAQEIQIEQPEPEISAEPFEFIEPAQEETISPAIINVPASRKKSFVPQKGIRLSRSTNLG